MTGSKNEITTMKIMHNPNEEEKGESEVIIVATWESSSKLRF